MSLVTRIAMAIVGLLVLILYSAAAFAGFLLLLWFAANPPDPLTVLIAFGIGVVLAGYFGYRLGTVRLVASLEATTLHRQQAPELHRRLDRLAETMRVERPPVLLADLGAPNALSIGGPRRGVIVLDQRLLRLLTIDEMEGILAHELAHMESYDTFLNTLAITAMRTVVGLLFFLFLPFVLLLTGVDRAAAWFAGRPRVRFGLATLFKAVVTWFLGILMSVFTLLFLAYSRRQEYAADQRAVSVTGDPAALARALAKISRAKEPRRGLFSFLYIHDDRRTQDERRLLSTHPPIEERIDRLLDRVDHPVTHHYVMRIRP